MSSVFQQLVNTTTAAWQAAKEALHNATSSRQAAEQKAKELPTKEERHSIKDPARAAEKDAKRKEKEAKKAHIVAQKKLAMWTAKMRKQKSKAKSTEKDVKPMKASQSKKTFETYGMRMIGGSQRNNRSRSLGIQKKPAPTPVTTNMVPQQLQMALKAPKKQPQQSKEEPEEQKGTTIQEEETAPNDTAQDAVQDSVQNTADPTPDPTTTNTSEETTKDTTAAAQGTTTPHQSKPSSGPTTSEEKAPKTSTQSNEDNVVAVILTISQGSSYDALFKRVRQDAPDGEVVRVYDVEAAFLPYLAAVLSAAPPRAEAGEDEDEAQGGSEAGASAPMQLNTRAIIAGTDLPRMTDTLAYTLQQAVDEIMDLEPESVVVNFECCSNCSSHSGFAEPRMHQHHRRHRHQHSGADPSIEFIGLCIAQGFLVMVSDFSLKALIKTWSSEHAILGHNPFTKLGEFGNSFTLKFNKDVLKESCSEQLKTLADLSSEGTAQVHAMGGTIVYGCKPDAAARSGYIMEVLTVMTKHDGGNSGRSYGRSSGRPAYNRAHLVTDSDGNTGTAGHVALQYPSGGILLASAGHWIELQRVTTDEKAFFSTVDADYGANSARTRQMRAEYDTMATPALKCQWLQQNAQMQIQSRSAAKYSKKKSLWAR